MPRDLKIETITAFISVDPADNNEGIIAFMRPDGMMMPMVAADQDMVDLMRPMAIQTAVASGYVIEVRKFSCSSVVEVITMFTPRPELVELAEEIEVTLFEAESAAKEDSEEEIVNPDQ